MAYRSVLKLAMGLALMTAAVPASAQYYWKPLDLRGAPATGAASAERRFRTDEGPFPLDVERPQAEFAAYMSSEMAKWGKVVKASGMKTQ